MALGGRKGLPWRLVVGIASVYAFALACESGVFGRPPDPAYLPLLVGQVICVGVVLLGLRLTGLGFVDADARVEPPGRFQFSLSDIFNWTTATAVLLAFFKCMPHKTVEIVRSSDWDIACLFNTLCTMLALASIWLVFAKRWLALRCVGCVIVVSLAAVAVGQVFGTPPRRSLRIPLLYWLFVFTAQAGWLIASLLVIRLAGFRLVWQWRFAKPTNGPQSDHTMAASGAKEDRPTSFLRP
jgi:CDP-diglyceride synthetase